MASKIISVFRDRFFVRLQSDRKDVEQAGCRSNNGLWWIAKRDGWFRPCWIYITEYPRGYFRIRNDMWMPIPKKAWSLSLPRVGGVERFELTFHKSELTDSIHDLIFFSCSVPGFQFSSPLFKETGEVPVYAWTIKGRQHYDATHPKANKSSGTS
ncbi:MAG TPA: hypothetical protein DHU55_09695 [Blastocatellia bacterium]|jgi:hypothetical protein|nr:hypothetical protein [Blastocatellia bacterium]